MAHTKYAFASLYFLPDCLYPNLIPFLFQVQAVVGQLAAKYVRAFLREKGKEVDESNLLFFGKRFEAGVDFGNHIRLSVQPFVAAEALVDGEQALQFMRMGERWVLYIPWQSGYETSGSGSSSNAIRGYLVLTFDMQLDSFSE